ncbi:meiotic cell cortex C-terminal pleckstrin homology-domain-containing protein [Protomyces lactucae-debilis]|uniref:Meiotic cell cortex C-terminal pleckstrin homology-domain-containing protein n=1 Tax=Protomyces lactucae-debilis TaxID=2754530 RepID=A0A1Y2F426_PROLT|nr:meiotic cell cortex C-terminal pleckstrin homology-domain-containing protein [Protomyces lactucae-debilis]ORY78668.1 meiotic cell cortex C-terminal pleckstrin homology-domain-containing protein [Protomyces lactucae-debilis]
MDTTLQAAVSDMSNTQQDTLPRPSAAAAVNNSRRRRQRRDVPITHEGHIGREGDAEESSAGIDTELQQELLLAIHQLQSQLEAAQAKYADLTNHYERVCVDLARSEEQLIRVQKQLSVETEKKRVRQEELEARLGSLTEDLTQTTQSLSQANRRLQQQNSELAKQAERVKQLEAELKDVQTEALYRQNAPALSEQCDGKADVDEQRPSSSDSSTASCADDDSVGEVHTAATTFHRRIESSVFTFPPRGARHSPSGSAAEESRLEVAVKHNRLVRPKSKISVTVPARVDSLWQELVDLAAEDADSSASSDSDSTRLCADAPEPQDEAVGKSVHLESVLLDEAIPRVTISVGTQTDQGVVDAETSPVTERLSLASSGILNLIKMREDMLDWLTAPDIDRAANQRSERHESTAMEQRFNYPASVPTLDMLVSNRTRSVTHKSVQSLLLALPTTAATASQFASSVGTPSILSNQLEVRKAKSFTMGLKRFKYPIGSVETRSVASSVSSSDGIGEVVRASTTNPMTRMIAQCMIGTYMYKYVRKTRPGLFRWRRGMEAEPVRHRRFVALRLSEMAVSWSFTRPAVGMQLGIRRFQIEEVLDIEDTSTMADGHDRSLLLLSGDQSIRFTCETRDDHQLWLDVLRWLIQKHQPKGRTTLAGSTIDNDLRGADFASVREGSLGRTVTYGSGLSSMPAPISRVRQFARDEQSVKGRPRPLTIASVSSSETTEVEMSSPEPSSQTLAQAHKVSSASDSTRKLAHGV